MLLTFDKDFGELAWRSGLPAYRDLKFISEVIVVSWWWNFRCSLVAHRFTPCDLVQAPLCAARSAIKSQLMFNLMHLDSAIKGDLIVRKNSEYRHAEFERRKSAELSGISTWITSREDLILSKLVGARDTGSEMQLRDVRTSIDESVDWPYLKDWAAKLGAAAKLDAGSK